MFPRTVVGSVRDSGGGFGVVFDFGVGKGNGVADFMRQPHFAGLRNGSE